MSMISKARVAQGLAVMRLEIRKHFLGRRAILAWLLASLPVVGLAARAIALAIFRDEQASLTVGEDVGVFANLIFPFILRFLVFFGCAGIFSHLARGDVLDKSIHYWFLAPVRREVVVAGKYAAGLLASAVIFSVSTLASLFFLFLPHGGEAISRHYLDGPGLGHALAYVFVVWLGCIGYGAAFLAIGLRFRNPIAISVVVLGWESLSFLMPAFLKRLTMVHYLEALCPVPVSGGPFALLADPPSAWVSIPGIVALSALLLWTAGHAIRRMDVMYGTD